MHPGREKKLMHPPLLLSGTSLCTNLWKMASSGIVAKLCHSWCLFTKLCPWLISSISFLFCGIWSLMTFFCRNLQLPFSQHCDSSRVVLLHPDHLHPVLHDRAGVLVLLLVGLQGGASQGGLGGDHPAGHVHHHGLDPEEFAPSGVHQGGRRLVRRLRLLRLQCSSWICSCQLCIEVTCETNVHCLLVFIRPKNLTYSKAWHSLTFPNSNIELNLLAVVKWRISNRGRTPSELQSRRRWRRRSWSCAPSMQST